MKLLYIYIYVKKRPENKNRSSYFCITIIGEGRHRRFLLFETFFLTSLIVRKRDFELTIDNFLESAKKEESIHSSTPR